MEMMMVIVTSLLHVKIRLINICEGSREYIINIKKIIFC